MREKIILLGLFLFTLVFLINIASASTPISTCSNLTTLGETYTLSENITSVWNLCIQFKNDNITLNCNGFSITNTTPLGSGYVTMQSYGYNNITVRDCKINVNTSGNFYGLKIINSNYSTIYNNTFRANTGIFNIVTEHTIISNNTFLGCDYGLKVDNSTNNLIYNNSVTGYGSHGILINMYSKDNLVYENFVNYTTYGILLEWWSSNNSVYNNVVNTANTAFYELHHTYNNRVYDNFFRSNKSTGSDILDNVTNSNYWNNNVTNANITIFATGVENITIRDMNISTTLAGGTHIRCFTLCNITLVNVTYTIDNAYSEYLAVGSYVWRKWYYQVYVNDSSGNPMNGVFISAYNSSNNKLITLITNPSGWTDRVEIIDYVRYNGARSYYSNYNINISKEGYKDFEKLYNVTAFGNKQDTITLTLLPTTELAQIVLKLIAGILVLLFLCMIAVFFASDIANIEVADAIKFMIIFFVCLIFAIATWQFIGELI